MRLRLPLLLVSAAFLLSACGGGTNDSRAVPADGATNDDGSPVTATVTARFDASAGVVPLPNSLLIGIPPDDLTLNLPFDPSDATAGTFQAVNSLDGWSTVAPWSAGFNTSLDPGSVIPGDTVRMFEVSVSNFLFVTGIVRELTPGVDFVATVSTSNPLAHSVVIVPLRPLRETTSYMAVLTRGITDTQGNNSTPDQQYFLGKRTSPLVDGNGNSTDPLLDNATAQALEPLRQIINTQEGAAAAVGIDPDDIIVSWTALTQSITPVQSAVRSTVQAQSSTLFAIPINTGFIGGAGLADIVAGVMNLPYYLEAPTAANPTAPLTGFWEAAPGAYLPPFDQLGLDPTSTNLTIYNPFPVQKSTQTVPVLMTVPNAASGMTRPPAGWPVAIFMHGLGGNRTQMLAIADSMALAGFAVVAIDQPLHGIASTVDADGNVVGPETNPFYIENSPLGPIASERTFDVDYINNLTGAPGPDGFIDASAAHFINLASLRTGRDHLRQAVVDLSHLAATIPTMDFTGDGLPDLDGGRIHYIGISQGSLAGIPFLAVEPNVNVGLLSVPGGGIAGILVGSPTFAPSILAGLAGLGIEPGSELFDLFILAAQTVLDSGDPINWGELTSLLNSVHVQLAIGDTVIPNTVEGFPLSGGEPINAVMGLQAIDSTTQDPMGLRTLTRFAVGGHGVLLSPAQSLEATAEAQGEAASMLATDGTVLQVTIPSVLAPASN